MLKVMLLTFALLLIVVVIASIGVFFKREPIKGSCGGLGALGIEKACNCEIPCDKVRANTLNKSDSTDTDDNLGVQIYRGNK